MVHSLVPLGHDDDDGNQDGKGDDDSDDNCDDAELGATFLLALVGVSHSVVCGSNIVVRLVNVRFNVIDHVSLLGDEIGEILEHIINFAHVALQRSNRLVAVLDHGVLSFDVAAQLVVLLLALGLDEGSLLVFFVTYGVVLRSSRARLSEGVCLSR